MESISPNIFTHNMRETVAFYDALGFQIVMNMPETGDRFDWVMMVNGSVTMMFQSFSSLGEELPEISRQNGASQLLYIKIKKIREYFEKIKYQVTVLKGLEITFYGATEFSILDNNNYVLTFAEDE
ncbi:glyoxalase [Mucilaginibacter flavidus]|uniref:glyoxalase n=1 Tax=Mucilaginibacter flavidus TaxID=2949309 RepID=UPI00209381A3|nr:glyoxalase [Mucilaginibacter flavidus]MCO5947299.1 glyoxalase [Mucilaginibacter flavidus]